MFGSVSNFLSDDKLNDTFNELVKWVDVSDSKVSIIHCYIPRLSLNKTSTVIVDSLSRGPDIIQMYPDQGPVSRKSRNFTGHFRMSQFPLYLKNGEDLRRQTSQLFFFLLS